MTSDPASGRPTGPPSGPLSHPKPEPSGPEQPPAPPPPPTGGRGGGGGGDGGGTGGGPGGGRGGRPWWRSVPVVASLAGVVVAAVALAVVLSRPDQAQAAVNAESVSYRAPDSWTPSTSTADRGVERLPTQQRHQYAGSAPELYGGSGDRAACDVERQISYLASDPAKTRAFASVLDVAPQALPDHLRGLTSVQLRLDTLVTNHGYRDGRARPYQAVLQAGTAVLIDEYGVPRVRCACGNPLDRPRVQRPEKVQGKTWPGFQQEEIVVVVPAPTPVPTFTLVDVRTGKRAERPHQGVTSRSPSPEPPSSPPTSPPASPPTSPPTSKPPVSPEPPPPDAPDEPRPPESPGDTASPDAPPPDAPPSSPGSPSERTATDPATETGTETDTGTEDGMGPGAAAPGA
ncbi:DUF6777 domain-containing protein [Streptomyces sp. DH12]|uniref:DUF6777 domain-containing protein n=1 Tax=Streptomyces sp. DH12 TaxID=2857010 RepID=UPI001E5E587C|nr:DUF6777 domain-containing protein [Streptomyces sp. DH12]